MIYNKIYEKLKIRRAYQNVSLLISHAETKKPNSEQNGGCRG